MNCEVFCALIDDVLDQELDHERKREWLEHRQGCAACALVAERATRTHAAIATATTVYANSIPTPIRPTLSLDRHQQNVRVWWWGSAVAAMLLIGIGLLTHQPRDSRAQEPLAISRDPALDASSLQQRIAELRALKTWQDNLVQTLTTSSQADSDRLWRLVACTYLPSNRLPPDVMARLPMSGGQSDLPPATVVSWQRTSRRGDHTTALEFKQFNDGSVHIEQRITSPEEETVTRVDAASWDLLREQHGAMCRELGLFNPEQGIEAGWPLPARGHIERDAQRVLRGESAPNGLALRLLTLNLAVSVKGPEELTTTMQQIVDRPWPHVTANSSSQDERRQPLMNAPVEELRALEQATGVARYPDAEWKLAMRCLASANPRVE